MFPFHVTPGSATPIFRQVIDQVRGAVASGQLTPGDALPSVRSLAAELVINANTVAKAYAALTRDGVIQSHRGRGYFVAAGRKIYTAAESRRRVEGSLRPVLAEARSLGMSADQIRSLVDKQLAELTPPPEKPS